MSEKNGAGRLKVYTYAREGELHAAVSGEFTLAAAQSTFLEILGAVRMNGCERVLVDGRQVTGEPTAIERFFYGEFVAGAVGKLGRGGGPMFAYVLHEPVLDPMRLGETAALARGMTVKVFDDYEIAMAWLHCGA